ncbi:MSCRAMM family adhesin SdrC, partial [Granulosicoccus sp.]|nr:MSCRAMM family adhesin SdrC [Granulosicoccus sp.]
GILDTLESNNADANLDGLIDANPQSDAPLNDDISLFADPVVGFSPPDTDSDGIADFRDHDSDNDGLFDTVEAFGSEADADRDGQLDNFVDDDGDGVNDVFSDAPVPATDTDGNGKPDSIEIDSDRDGIPDLVESGGIDQDGDGQVDDFVDADRDGVDDGTAAVPLVIIDSDADGKPDYQDTDSDNDGISDLVETGGGQMLMEMVLRMDQSWVLHYQTRMVMVFQTISKQVSVTLSELVCLEAVVRLREALARV